MWTFLLALFFSAGAHAQIDRLVVGTGDPSFTCVPTPTCTDAAACAPFESTDICDPSDGYCVDPSYREAICCEGDGDECPVLASPMGAVTGLCTEIVNDLIETRGHVCVYPAVTFCQHAGEAWVYDAKVVECMTDHETSAPVSLWVNGDCDDDACRNGLDPDPCNADVGCPTGPLSDAGPTMTTDAGGGGNVDSGPAARIDSGSRGGEVPLDPTNDVRFHGAGGCSCRVPEDGRAPGALGAALPVLAALLLLSRRRRSV